MRHCVNDVRKGRQFLRRPMYRPAIPTAPKCGLRPHFGAGTQVLSDFYFLSVVLLVVRYLLGEEKSVLAL